MQRESSPARRRRQQRRLPGTAELGPGTYTVTNGDGAPGANPAFTAWNFNSSGPNWVWDFLIIDDATRQVVMDSCCGTQIYPTQMDAALSAHAQDFSQPFTLTQQTTLDFVTEDYYPYDNLGGVALELAPEPSALLLFAAAIASLALQRAATPCGPRVAMADGLEMRPPRGAAAPGRVRASR